MAEHRWWRRGLTLAVLVLVGLGVSYTLVRRPDSRASPLGQASTDGRDRIARGSFERCARAPSPVPLGGRVELALFMGAEVDPIRADEVRSALTRFWGDYAVVVHENNAPRPIALEAAFAAGFAELEPVRGDAQATGARLYRELRALLLAHAFPRQDRINVVVLRDIVHPRAAAAAVLGDLVGLTVAPELLDAGDSEQAAVLEALALPGSFTPTVLLSDRHLERMGDVAFVAAVAHESGHALGLTHVSARANLMAAGEHDCLPGLDAQQLAVVASSPLTNSAGARQ